MAFNAEKYIEQLLSQANYLPPDVFVDDSSIPEAKNIIDFLHNEEFVGNLLPTKLFPRQAEMLIKLNAEYCPRCTDLKYFLGSNEKGISENIKVNEDFDTFFSKVKLLEYGVCPHCGAKKSELVLNKELPVHTELVILLGQRSGKSAVTSMQLSYTTHKFLKVPNLQRTYSLLPTAPFVISMIGMSFEKAKLLLYNAYYEYLTKGNWFKRYHEFLREEQARQGLKEELFAIKDTFARYKHKNILIAPFGPDKRKLRGNTSIAAGCDEIGWFLPGQEGGIKFDADEIYTAINNSLMTAKEAYLKLLAQGYNNLPAPINCNLSSPSSKKDKICRLYEESKFDPYMYGAHLATWEVNPNLPLEGPTMQGLMRKNERDFWRDFGAVPPNSSNAFFSDVSLLSPIYNSGLQNVCKLKKYTHFLGEKEFTSGKLIIPKAETIKPNRVMALDAGYCNNSFAFAVAHIKADSNKNKVVIFDSLVEIIPNDLAPLNYSKIYEDVIVPIIKELNIKVVSTDRWQNIKILSDIENDKSLRCKTKTYSVKYSDFLTFRQSIYDRMVQIPKPELKNNEIELAGNDSYPKGFENLPLSHFIFQALTVVDMMGKTVTKGQGTTDDLFRAATLAHSILLSEEFKNILKGSQIGSSSNRVLGALPTAMASMGSSRIGAIPTSASNPYRR